MDLVRATVSAASTNWKIKTLLSSFSHSHVANQKRRPTRFSSSSTISRRPSHINSGCLIYYRKEVRERRGTPTETLNWFPVLNTSTLLLKVNTSLLFKLLPFRWKRPTSCKIGEEKQASVAATMISFLDLDLLLVNLNECHQSNAILRIPPNLWSKKTWKTLD